MAHKIVKRYEQIKYIAARRPFINYHFQIENMIPLVYKTNLIQFRLILASRNLAFYLNTDLVMQNRHPSHLIFHGLTYSGYKNIGTV